MNSLSLLPHQPNELGHLSDEPDVQKESPVLNNFASKFYCEFNSAIKLLHPCEYFAVLS
jgi:hypothetical protein